MFSVLNNTVAVYRAVCSLADHGLRNEKPLPRLDNIAKTARIDRSHMPPK